MRKKRVGLISEHASPLALLGGVDSGGQNVYVGQLARLLSRFGYQVDVFTRRDHPDSPDIVPWAEDSRIIHVPAGPAAPVRKEELLPFMGEFTEFLIRCTQGRRCYDLFHANFFMSALVAADLKRLSALPFVVTFHALGRVRRRHQRGRDAFPKSRLAIEDRVVREADRIIAEYPQDEDDLINLYAADPSQIVTIPCGFDPAEFWPMGKRRARSALGIDAEERVVLQLGRMVPRKGIDNVIRALARLSSGHGLSARLLIVGGESETPDPEIGRLQAIAEEEGVAQAVAFVGSRGRDVLRYYYSAADVFVTTPWYEPFGITPVEAAACGTPVIGAAVGGIKTTVVDGETGYLVPPHDPDALAERLALLFRDPLLSERLGRQAVRRANALFTWERVASEIARVYDDVTKTRPVRADGIPSLATAGLSLLGPLPRVMVPEEVEW
jgi:glycosyltransferase involved in cell wall biosynthesis